MIYVIGPNGSSVAKIGYTGGKPSKRLSEIQIGNPATLAVLWAGAGDKALEGKLHTALRPYNVRGEWFDFRGLDPAEEVQAAILSINQGLMPKQSHRGAPTQNTPTEQMPNCVCGHKAAKHGRNGCIVAGYDEWLDCQCSVYASSALREGLSPATRVPTPQHKAGGWVGPIPAEAKTNRQHRWYDAVHKEIEGMRWPGGAPMVPGAWSERLADMVIWRIVGCRNPSGYPVVVLDEIIRMEWPNSVPMVPGVYAEDLADRIATRAL